MILRNVAARALYCGFRQVFTTSKSLHAKITGHQRCNYSTSDQVVSCSLDPRNGVATLKLNHPPVNCLSPKLIQQWIETMRQLEQDPKCKALILASNIPDIFCAGLDFKELRRPEREQYLNYHRSTAQLWTSIYSSRMPTIAAVNGASPGFGCIIAMCCDYRIMKIGKGRIGLLEVHLGISLKSWIVDLFVSLVGHRHGEMGLTRGLMYRAEEAMHVGLVDEVASSDEELLKLATRQAELLAELPNDLRHGAKMLLRQPFLDKFESTRAAAEQRVADAVMSQKQQVDIDDFVEKLKTRKKPTDSS